MKHLKGLKASEEAGKLMDPRVKTTYLFMLDARKFRAESLEYIVRYAGKAYSTLYNRMVWP